MPTYSPARLGGVAVTAEVIPDNTIRVLDHGFVRLDDAMADDLSVVNGARVSFARRKEEMDESDEGLIRFLMRDRHGTPFEHNSFRYHIRCPIFVAREWMRHRVGSFNEFSLRYAKATDDFYVPEPDDVRARLREREAKAVWIVQSETSTGVVADVRALAAAAKEAGALVVVDAVSSLGAVPCETDAWGLDVVVSGSQKALMTPPGLGTCAVSKAAFAATGSSPRFYFDWERTRKAQAKLDAPFTPPVSLVAGLDVALGLLLEEGLEAAFERHVRLGRA